MTFGKFYMVWVLMGFSASTLSYAYGPCDIDEAKLCDGNLHQQTVKECLHKNLDQLSPECRDFVKTKEKSWSKIRVSWQEVRSSCEAEIKKNCRDLEPDAQEMMKAIQVCLMSTAQSLTSECKRNLNRHIREHQPNIKEIP